MALLRRRAGPGWASAAAAVRVHRGRHRHLGRPRPPQHARELRGRPRRHRRVGTDLPDRRAVEHGRERSAGGDVPPRCAAGRRVAVGTRHGHRAPPHPGHRPDQLAADAGADAGPAGAGRDAGPHRAGGGRPPPPDPGRPGGQARQNAARDRHFRSKAARRVREARQGDGRRRRAHRLGRGQGPAEGAARADCRPLQHEGAHRRRTRLAVGIRHAADARDAGRDPRDHGLGLLPGPRRGAARVVPSDQRLVPLFPGRTSHGPPDRSGPGRGGRSLRAGPFRPWERGGVLPFILPGEHRSVPFEHRGTRGRSRPPGRAAAERRNRGRTRERRGDEHRCVPVEHRGPSPAAGGDEAGDRPPGAEGTRAGTNRGPTPGLGRR